MRRRRWLAAGVGALALAIALGGVSLAKTSAAKSDKTGRAKLAQLYKERLASHLGVGAAALDAARKAALEDVIAQALKDGTITPTQAAELRRRLSEEGLDEGFPGGWFKHKGFGHGFGFAKGRIFKEAMAAVLDKLGLTPGELKQELRAGKTFAEIAKAHGTTLAALGQTAANAIKDDLDAMVKDGTITRQRADAILEKLRAGEFPLMHKGFGRKAA